jgi:hypoxanthine phosphoribosyltransferase
VKEQAFKPPEIQRVLFSAEEIRRRLFELAAQISQDYRTLLGEDLTKSPPIAIGLLRGAVVFLSDLVRALTIPVEMDFLQISSYGRATEPGALRLVKDLEGPIKGRHLLIVEDIVDTGQTLSFLKDELSARGPASIKLCALIDKTARRRKAVKLDYVGFRLEEDAFLVGYGLDYAEKYRNLPYVAALKPEALR